MVNWFELMKRVQIKPAWSEIIQLLWCCMQWEYSNNPPTILLDSDNWKSILCISSKIMFTLFMFFSALLFRYLVEIIVNQPLFACEKFLQGSQEPFCHEYFLPRTSSCYIVVFKKKKVWIRLCRKNKSFILGNSRNIVVINNSWFNYSI